MAVAFDPTKLGRNTPSLTRAQYRNEVSFVCNIVCLFVCLCMLAVVIDIAVIVLYGLIFFISLSFSLHT